MKKKNREREREREGERESCCPRTYHVYLSTSVSLDCLTINRGYLIMLYRSEVDSNAVCQYVSTQ